MIFFVIDEQVIRYIIMGNWWIYYQDQYHQATENDIVTIDFSTGDSGRVLGLASSSGCTTRNLCHWSET